MGERVGETCCSHRSESRHGEELVTTGPEDCLNRSEVGEQRPGGNGRDPGNGGEHRFGRRRRGPRLRSLRVEWPIRGAGDAHATEGCSDEPARRIARILAPECQHILFGRCQDDPSHSSRGKWTGIEVMAFHEKVRPARVRTQTPELAPESPFDNGQVEIPNRLALDENPIAEVVATRGENPDEDACTELDQLANHDLALVHVGCDRRRRCAGHSASLSTKPSHVCAYRSREARTT